MPRPKRTRAASARAAPVAKEPAPAPAPAPVQPSSDPSTDIYDISDREKEKARRGRDVLAAPVAAMTARVSRASLRSQQQKRDGAASTSAGAPPKPQGDSAESADDVELGRRGAATPLQSGRMADISGLDLDDSMFDDLDTTINTAGPASAQRSLDTSVLSASHFKRRPRAGSFLSRDDGPIRPGSRAGPTTPGYSAAFNIANFRRRAREPSILGTAQKERAQRPEPDTDLDLDDRTDEEEDDDEVEAEPMPELEKDENDVFAPQAESTPPPPRRSSRRSRPAARDDEPEPQASGTNTRKRKSTEAHAQRPRSSPFRENPMAPAEDDSELSDVASPSPSLPLQLVRPSTPVLDEEVAPPMSSDSSDDDAAIWPPVQSLARGRTRRAPEALRRTPVREVENLSDMSSPPSLTYSPNYDEPSPPPQKAKRQTRKAAASKESKLTTADLTSLLPRRRHRPNRAYDSAEEVDASALGNRDDELSYIDVGSRRQPGGSSSRTGNRNQSATTSRSTQPKGKQPAGSTKPTKRTYGRTSDKENQDGDDGDDGANRHEREAGTENSEEMVSRVGEELKNASRKFAEVDQWSLEYEEMTQSSSPRDAR